MNLTSVGTVRSQSPSRTRALPSYVDARSLRLVQVATADFQSVLRMQDNQGNEVSLWTEDGSPGMTVGFNKPQSDVERHTMRPDEATQLLRIVQQQDFKACAHANAARPEDERCRVDESAYKLFVDCLKKQTRASRHPSHGQ